MQTTSESRQVKWSAAKKKAARAAFELALSREMVAIRHEVEALLKASPEPTQVWKVLDYLSGKQRELDSKYDYHYSVLIFVFGRLVGERWLSEAELGKLSGDKLDLIKRMAFRYQDAKSGAR